MNYQKGKVGEIIDKMGELLDTTGAPGIVINMVFKKPTESPINNKAFMFAEVDGDAGEKGIIMLLQDPETGLYDPIQVVYEDMGKNKFMINPLVEAYYSIEDTMVLLSALDSFVHGVDNPDVMIVKDNDYVQPTPAPAKRTLH